MSEAGPFSTLIEGFLMQDILINKGYKSFCYNGVTIRVYSTDPSHLIWLEEFLSPSFDCVAGVSHDCTVALVADTHQYTEILGRGAHPDGATVDCFALDTNVIQLPLWKSAGDGKVIFDIDRRAFYLVNQDKTEICILTLNDNMSARSALMRVVRELAMTYSQSMGGLIIHGSSLVAGDRGVIIAGPKKAGKTTLLIHALGQPSVHFVSNDRVVVFFEETGPILRGMPTIVSLREETLENFPHVRRRLLASSYHHRLSLKETRQQIPRASRERPDGRWSLSPAQFCTLLQVCPVAEGQAWALVFPRVTGASGTIHLEEISPDEGAVRLTASLFRANSSQKTADVFSLATKDLSPDRVRLESRCHQLTSRVRCFDCQLGREAYQDEASAAIFVNHLIA